MRLNPLGVSKVLLSIQMLGQDQVGLRLEPVQRQEQTPHWDGEEGALPRTRRPKQAQICYLLRRVHPGCSRVVGEPAG